MRKVDDGKKKEKRKKNGVFSGHYIIASGLPRERLRPNDDRWNAARLCQKRVYCMSVFVVCEILFASIICV